MADYSGYELLCPRGPSRLRGDHSRTSERQRAGGGTQVSIKYADKVTISQPCEISHLIKPGTAPNTELFVSIRKSLKMKYLEDSACIVPFLYEEVDLNYSLQDYYLDLKIEERNLDGVFKTGTIIPLEKIFYSEDKHGLRCKANILVTGDAGYGKTTLTRKLCWDWAEMQTGSYISCFDIVVNLPLIEIGDKPIRDSILKSLELKERQFESLISMNLKWLIILDGLDEATKPDIVFSFLRDHKNIFWRDSQNSTVVVTGRPYAVKRSARRLFNRRVTILGMSTENQMKYIDAIFPENSKGKVKMVESLKHDTFLCKAAECPLMLHMLCHVYEMERDNEDLAITSKTVLYTKLFKLLRTRYFNKYKMADANVGDDVLGNHLFIRLGQLANQTLRSYDIVDNKRLRSMFPKEDEYEEVLRLGIILGVPTKFRMESIIKYDFFHCTFAEFLEAMYISSLSRTDDSTEDLEKILPTHNDFGTAIFVAGLLGQGVVTNKQILLWISGNKRTLSELLEIKNEGGLDTSSWGVICSLIRRIEYNDTVSERRLMDSEFTLDNFQMIEVRTNEPDERFWGYVGKIINSSSHRTEFTIDFPVSVVHYLSYKMGVEIRFIDVEAVMNELLHVGNLLRRKENPFRVLVYIHPADVTCVTEGEPPRNEKPWYKLKRGSPVGLLARSFCSISECQQTNSGGFWNFGKIQLCYCKQFGIVKTERVNREKLSVVPILVVTRAQYNLLTQQGSSYHENLRVVDFKDTPMSSKTYDFRAPKQIGHTNAKGVFDHLRIWRIEVYHSHEWNSEHELINSLEILLQRKRTLCSIV